MSQVTFNPNVSQTGSPEQVQEGTVAPSVSGAATPPPVTPGAGGVDFAALGIPALAAPHLGALSLEQLVKAVGHEGRRLAVQQGLEAIRMKGDEIKELNDKRMEEVQKQLEELRKKEKLNPFLKFFKWLGMVLGAIAAAVTTAVGAITGNALLVAGGIIALTMLANSIASEASGGKVSIGAGIGAIAKACGASEETAKWIGFAFEMAITVVGVGVTLGGSFGSAVSQSATTAMKVANAITVGTTIASGVNSMGQGALSIASSVYDYRIALAKAEMKDLQAILERIQTAMQSEEDFVKATMQRCEELLGKVHEIVQDNISTQTAILTGGSPSMA